MWEEFDKIKGTCIVQVPKSKQLVLEKLCKSKKIQAKKMIKDVKGMIDENLKEMAHGWWFDYNKYNRYDAVSKDKFLTLKPRALLARLF